MKGFAAKLQEATRARKTTVDVDANTSKIRAKLAAITRRREALIDVNVQNLAVLFTLAAAMNTATMSTRMAAAGMTRFGSSVALVGVIGAAVAPALGLLSTAILGIPGAISVAGAAIAALWLGMDGIKRAAMVAKPALDALKASVSATFEAGMVPVFQQIANVLLPGITAGMNGVAVGLIAVASGFVATLTSAAGMAGINAILTNTQLFLQTIVPFVQSMTSGFITLGVAGSAALIPFGEILNGIGLQFQQMSERMAANGTLQAAFAVLGTTVGILASFFLRLIEAGAGIMVRLGPSFTEFLTVLTNGIIAMLPFLESFALAFMNIATPILSFLLPALGFLAPVLGPLAAIFTFVGMALAIVGAIMWAVNTAVVTMTWSLIRMGVAWFIGLGPIAWVVAGIIALVGTFIWLWTTCDWFRNFWIAIWGGIVAAFTWAWNGIGAVLGFVWHSVLLPIFGAIGWFAGVIGNAFLWLWNNVVVPAWNGIGAAIGWAWHVIILPIFNAIGFAIRILAAILFTILVAPWIVAWNLLTAAISWAWGAVIAPVFGAIGNAATWLWVNVLAPTFRAIGGAWSALWSGVRWVYDYVVKPCWDALGAAAAWLWTNALAPTFRAIGNAWRALMDGIKWVWDHILRPCWDAIAGAANWLWNSVLRLVFDAIGGAWRGLLAGMEFVWSSVLRPCWNAVQAAANFLWNNVLRPVFGAIGGAWSGLLNGMNWVWLNILRPMFDAVKNTIDWLARGFESAVNWIRDIWNRMIAITAAPVNFVIDAVYNKGIVPAWGKIAGWLGLPGLALAAPIRYATGGQVPGSGNRDSVPAMLMPGEYVLSKKVVEAWGMDNIHAAHQAARHGDDGGMVPHFAKGGPVHTWPAMWRIVQDMNIGARKTSDFRPGSSGYHGKGQAIDLVGNFAAIADALGRKFPNATQIISAQWRGGTGILNGRPHFYAKDNPGHRDHVHWAMTPEALGGADGAGGGGLFDIVSLVVGWFRDTLMKPVMDTAGGLLGKFGNNPYTQAPNKIPGKALDAGTEWVKGKAYDIWGHIAHLFSWMFGGGGGGGGFSGNAEMWRGLVIEALKRLGLPLSWADVTLNQIRTESGGNPRAVNNWDSNARRGTPSGGLLQTIAPTFARWRDPGLANNMFDPLANIVASMRYAMARYGSLPAAYRGVGYSEGGPVMAGLFDNGGILPPTPGGYGMYANHSGRKEAVLTNEQMRWLRGAADNRGGGGDIYTTVNAKTDASPEHIAHSINRHVGMKLRS